MAGKTSICYLLGLCLILSTVRCTGSQVCSTDEISNLQIDPTGNNCQSKCDCNNQRYEGVCLAERCVARKRDACVTPGEKSECFPFQFTPEEKCLGVKICQPASLRERLWGDCKIAHVLQEEKGLTLCADGIDNDCDGKIDNVDDACGVCQPGAQRSCYEAAPQTQNVGLCKAGIQKCSKDGLWGVCDGAILPTAEDCNGKDDDCNGKVDDLKAGTRPCYTGKTGCKKEKDGTYQCTAPCKSGTQRCTDGVWGSCEGEVAAPAEECNAQDDDCNGEIDDDGAGGPLSQPCYEGKTGCTKQDDGSYQCEGICTTGVRECTLGIWSQCTAHQRSKAEECNGKDDDCDGQVDNIAPQSCYSGPAGTELRPPCKAGQQVCEQGTWGACKGEVLPPKEVCDGKDNDCDGEIDNIASCVTTFAGSGQAVTLDGPAKSASFNGPAGIAFDSAGALYVAEQFGHKIRKIALVKEGTCGNESRYTGWCVTTFAGSGRMGFVNGAGATARFSQPHGLAIDDKDNVYVSEWGNNRIRKITPAGIVSNYAGDGTKGVTDGPGATARFNLPTGLTFDSQGALYLGNTGGPNQRIRKLVEVTNASCGARTNYTGVCVSSYAGTTRGFAEGGSLQVQFNQPLSIVSGGPGILFVADFSNRRIRQITQVTNGRCLSLTGYTGPCTSTYAGSGQSGSLDGAALQASFVSPHGLFYDPSGVLFVAEFQGHTVRIIDKSGTVSTLAGGGTPGFLDGVGTNALLNNPHSLAGFGRYLYISDHGNHRIRRIPIQ